MSDRLDDRINAFVIELLDDPPPVPNFGLDAAPTGRPLQSAVPRLRLTGPAVAVAAFVAVVVAVGVVALVPWRSGIEHQQPTTVPPATTTVPLATTTVPPANGPGFYGLIGFEMLYVEDLPAGSHWTRELASGVQAGWCDGTGLSDITGDGPLAGLSDQAIARFTNDTVDVHHMVFADDPANVQAAFDEIRRQTSSCLDDPDQWVDSRIAELSAMPLSPLGDDRFGIRSTVETEAGGQAEGFLAVVLNGSRIIVVQTEPLPAPPDQPDLVSRDDFRAILVAAVARSIGALPEDAATTVEMLTTSDLPADLNLRLYNEATDRGDGIGGWGSSEHGVLAVRCYAEDPQSITAWRLDPSPMSFDGDPPLTRPLNSAQFKAFYTDTDPSAVVGEALYVDSSDTVEYTFNAMNTATIGCFDSGISGFGNGGESSRIALPTIGDDAIAVRVTARLSPVPSQTKYDLFRLAIIRDDTRLLIVEAHELVMSEEDLPQISDHEFVAIVEAAANRLTP